MWLLNRIVCLNVVIKQNLSPACVDLFLCEGTDFIIRLARQLPAASYSSP